MPRTAGDCAYCGRSVGPMMWSAFALPGAGMVRIHTRRCLAAMWKKFHGYVPDDIRERSLAKL